jgi:hypothetical protein
MTAPNDRPDAAPDDQMTDEADELWAYLATPSGPGEAGRLDYDRAIAHLTADPVNTLVVEDRGAGTRSTVRRDRAYPGLYVVQDAAGDPACACGPLPALNAVQAAHANVTRFYA